MIYDMVCVMVCTFETQLSHERCGLKARVHQLEQVVPRVPKFRYLSESKRNFSEISEKLNSESKFRYLIADKFK